MPGPGQTAFKLVVTFVHIVTTEWEMFSDHGLPLSIVQRAPTFP